MEVDNQTLKDLEIFQGKKTIFGMLDNTSSLGGKAILKKIFAYPKNNIEEINQVQSTLKTILNSIDKWNLHFSEATSSLITEYMNTNLISVRSKKKLFVMVEGYLYKQEFKYYYNFFVKGTAETIDFIQRMNNFYNRIKVEETPFLLKSVIEKIKDILANKTIKAIIDLSMDKASYTKVFYWDKVLREEVEYEIKTLLNCTYELDAYIAMAKAVRMYKLTFPTFVESDEATLKIKGLRHIFLSRGKRNDLIYEQSNNFMFLTGPNMAGKTTYLKSSACSIYLAHLGMGVPAESMELTLFDGIFTSISISDNLTDGHSYYYSEVKRVKEVAIKLRNQEKLFIIFDELFKGTNVSDAYEGSKMVITGFANWKKSFFILSSHLIELEKDIRIIPNIFFKYFDSKIVDRKPVFSYELKDGVSSERLGLIILENEDIVKILTPC